MEKRSFRDKNETCLRGSRIANHLLSIRPTEVPFCFRLVSIELKNMEKLTQAKELTDSNDLALNCWFLTGATATGKTSISLEMAKILNAEIISLDSMAIYRGMDIGTAKPSRDIRAEVGHHLIDIIEPPHLFSVSQYRQAAATAISDIRKRGKEVLFVGGTALYLKVMLRGMFEGPPADWDFRREVELELQEMGADFLHQRLEMIDPISAHLLHPNDHRRIIRALEVFRLTGKPISHWQMQFDESRPADQCRVFWLHHPRPVLHERIERRVDQMFADGLVDEVTALTNEYQTLGKTASQAVGYKEVISHLAGEMSLAETVDKVKSRTRKFARHQETWFRGLRECRLVELPDQFDPRPLAESLVKEGEMVNIPAE